MGKKEARLIMRKKVWFLLVSLALLLVYGCGTLQGTAEGMKKDWESAKKIDDWMRKNMW